MIFSERTHWDLTEDDLALRARQRRATGAPFADLTLSNPTACGFLYPPDLLAPLADPRAALYTPEPFGMVAAREAVSTYYRDHAATVAVPSLCLTTSTSEAYSFLFRLLCAPGDQVLVARPSYPLFDFIAQLDHVHLREYPLFYDPNSNPNADPNPPTTTAPSHSAGGWSIDLSALAASITPRTRALIVVHPNNPTGHFASLAEVQALQQLCVQHRLALIVDEVFLDYALDPAAVFTFAAQPAPCLTFVLSGISKICALPQMKVSWIATLGPHDLVAAALARLEVIADIFLSMNAPVQFALPHWLAGRHDLQQQVRDRMRRNLTALDRRLAGTTAQRLALQAGWTTILRVPRSVDSPAGSPQDFAPAALDAGVLLQPGEFYGLPAGRAVLSLLTPPSQWDEGLARLPIDS